jgi:hypothetical protein
MVSFSEIFGDDAPEPAKKITMPQLPFEDQVGWQHSKPSDRSLAKSVSIMRDAFSDEVAGDLPSAEDAFPVGHAAVAELNKMVEPNTQAIDLMLKSGGKPAAKLKNMMSKGSYTLTEGMTKLVENFQEFFSPEEHKLLQQAIKALDLPGFLQLVNQRVYQESV